MSVQGGITGQGNNPRLLQEGINAIAQDEYNDYEPEYTKYLETHTSVKAYEEDVSQGGFGLAKRKPEGTSVEYDNMQQGWITRYNHFVYALGAIITWEAIEDNLYQNLMMRTGVMLKRSLVHTKEQVSANLFNNAYNTANPIGDGLSLFNQNHLLIKGGTFANQNASFAALSETALEDAIIAVEDFRDDAGLLIDA